MTLNVQNDAGSVADANGYVSEAELDAYFADRNITLAQTSAEKEAAIIKATDLIDYRFGISFVGTKKALAQTTEWPRTNATNVYGFDVSDLIPVALKKACYEFAYLSLTGTDISPNPTYDATGQNVKRTKTKVDVIETELEYKDDFASNNEPSFPKAEGYLKPLLGNVGGLVQQAFRA